MTMHAMPTYTCPKPSFPKWLIPGVVFYLAMASSLIWSSLTITITESESDRIILDTWTTSLIKDLINGNADPELYGMIAGSIGTQILFFIVGCLIGSTAVAMLIRKRGTSTASYFINMFQLFTGLAFFYYYPRDKEFNYLWFGFVLCVPALFQYWILTKPSVRRWLKSYAIEFYKINTSNTLIRKFLKHASFRKGMSSMVLGFEVLIIMLSLYVLSDALVSLLFMKITDTFGNFIERVFTLFSILLSLSYPIILYPVIGVVALFWKRPSRILLLRPFHAPEVSVTLKSIIQDTVGYFGHVYTLSDAEISQPWYIRWPVALPQMWLLHFHSLHLGRLESVIKMEKKICKTVARNINWLASSGKLFKVSASSEMWKTCVTSLIKRSEVVIFDISCPSENIIWELNEIHHNKSRKNVIFVANISNINKSMEFLELQGVNPELGINIFSYDDEGMNFLEQFIKQVACILSKRSAN
ncbi:hypothetical protein [Saccharicrinis sp. GN24d3]|uniref:hypothetical protein n=1 Tax=Saccharicrinis sp. GN24d3 TaxID=3458416 RepID=UPI004036B1BE